MIVAESAVAFKSEVREALQNCQGLQSIDPLYVIEIDHEIDMALLRDGDGEEWNWFPLDMLVALPDPDRDIRIFEKYEGY